MELQASGVQNVVLKINQWGGNKILDFLWLAHPFKISALGMLYNSQTSLLKWNIHGTC